MRNLIAGLSLLPILIIGVIAVSWCVNLYKLTQCDFQPSWKGEIIHAVGLIPVASVVTVWNNAK